MTNVYIASATPTVFQRATPLFSTRASEDPKVLTGPFLAMGSRISALWVRAELWYCSLCLLLATGYHESKRAPLIRTSNAPLLTPMYYDNDVCECNYSDQAKKGGGV